MGLRMGEARALECGDVDRIGDSIIVRTPSRTTRSSRRSRRTSASFRSTRRYGDPRRSDAETKHGLREWSFHALRHWFISAMVRGGASMEAVRRIAGHLELETTQLYCHAEGAELVAAVSLVNGNRVGTRKRIASK